MSTLDGKVNRVSHEGEYQVSEAGRPLNIQGRTGLSGRGVLGKWGPNHAADPIVTRWRRNQAGEIIKNEETGKNVLEFVSIQRKDSGEWAIPGGMVDPGERGEEWCFLLCPCRPSAFTVKELLFRIRHCLKTLFNIKFECLSTKSS